MKRLNLTLASILPCYYSWSILSSLLVICFFSCACRNKTAADQLVPVPIDNSSIANTENQGSQQLYTSPGIIESKYNDIVKEIKARPDYTLFGQFLENGKYSNILMRLDTLEYYILVPTDTELKKLDKAELSQLIYPEVSNQTNLNFLLSHVAFCIADPAAKKVYRTLANKSISVDANSKNITIDNRQFPVIDEAKLPPSIRIFFIDNYLN